MSGTFVSISGSTVTLSDPKGKNSTHQVAAGATVTLNGAAAKLADLQAGDSVSLSGDPATSVSASRPK